MDRKTPTTPKEKLKKHDINEKKKYAMFLKRNQSNFFETS